MKIVSGLVIAVLALGVGTTAPASAADADKKKSDKKAGEKKAESVYQAAVPSKKDDTAKVWTNAELAKLGNEAFATTAAAPADGSAPTGGDSGSLKWLQEREQRVQGRTERIAMAQAKLDAAEAKLANLQKQLLATVNPFSARPQLSEEEKKERRMSRENASQRYERSKRVTDEARAEVQTAQTELQRAKAGR